MTFCIGGPPICLSSPTLQSPSLEFHEEVLHLCLVFEVMVYLTRLDAEIGLLELYGMC